MLEKLKEGKFYRRDIDGLRAIAIFLVLIYHLFPEIIRGGYIGVDIFFVISGFIITKTILFDLDRNTFSIKIFLFKRIRRLYPSLLFVLISTYVLGWILLMPREFAGLSKHIVSSLGFVQNFVLWNEVGYFDDAPQLKPLLHLWSLSIEEQFYLIWPWLLYLIYRLKKTKFYYLSVFLFFSFLFNVVSVRSHQDFAFYWPFTRFWELLCGCLLALIHSEKKNTVVLTRFATPVSFFGLFLILIASVSFSRETQFPGFAALLPVVGAAFIIFFDESLINQRVLSTRVLVWIGLISYPLYLWHWILISFEYFAFGAMSSGMNKIGIFFLSVILAWLTYRYIEQPIRRLSKLSIVSPTLLSISIGLGILSFITYQKNGFPDRKKSELPSELHALLDPGFGGYIAKNWREHSCFLAKDETFENFKKYCFEDSGKLKVVIWGDSHAAALYTGFRNHQGKKAFDLSQYTASACAPLLLWEGAANKNCNSVNDQIFKNLSKIKPDIIILHASWDWDEYDLRFLEITIENLRKIDKTRIIVVGQSPNWKEKVPANIISYFKTFGKLPNPNTDFGLNQLEQTLKLEKKIKKTAVKHNAEFISMIEVLCPQNECLLYVGDSVQNVTSLDQGHLSDSGASYVVQAIEKKLFPGKSNFDNQQNE
ncbi:acyltransferase family protein [Leptospira vanthielii]|uniref:Acyltransferase n=1 Tax=Leptospira vanthielii TaxID=293085 RepID=A0ABY2NSQ3_9LEPT|nr:acyltransferase family protein [Leptospira vanthielii]TGM60660.1 acyltransferase [Leptospira vanthielii]